MPDSKSILKIFEVLISTYQVLYPVCISSNLNKPSEASFPKPPFWNQDVLDLVGEEFENKKDFRSHLAVHDIFASSADSLGQLNLVPEKI